MLHHDHLPYASPWRRLAALLLDLLIVLVATLILFVPLFMIVSPRTAASPEFESRTNALGYLISWMYFALMESSAKQATIGKSLLGLVVTDLNGDRISFFLACYWASLWEVDFRTDSINWLLHGLLHREAGKPFTT